METIIIMGTWTGATLLMAYSFWHESKWKEWGLRLAAIGLFCGFQGWNLFFIFPFTPVLTPLFSLCVVLIGGVWAGTTRKKARKNQEVSQ